MINRWTPIRRDGSIPAKLRTDQEYVVYFRIKKGKQQVKITSARKRGKHD